MTLLQLPPEIRIHILKMVLYSPASKPSCPSAGQEGRKRKSATGFHARGVWLQPHMRNHTILLLLINKQIHDEVKFALKRPPTDYNVDIMFVKSYGLWTTWDLPAFQRTQQIDQVYATMRLFEPTPDLDDRFAASPLRFRRGCGGPERCVWSFLALLTGVLTHGPGYVGGGRGIEPRYTVRRIIIDILTPTDKPVHDNILQDFGPGARAQATWDQHRGAGFSDTSAPTAERLACYLRDHLQRLFSLTSYESANHAMVVYENVQDHIALLVNGVEHTRFDIGQLLEEGQPLSSGQVLEIVTRCEDDYIKWRNWVLERRKRMADGLEVDYSSKPVTRIARR